MKKMRGMTEGDKRAGKGKGGWIRDRIGKTVAKDEGVWESVKWEEGKGRIKEGNRKEKKQKGIREKERKVEVGGKGEMRKEREGWRGIGGKQRNLLKETMNRSRGMRNGKRKREEQDKQTNSHQLSKTNFNTPRKLHPFPNTTHPHGCEISNKCWCQWHTTSKIGMFVVTCRFNVTIMWWECFYLWSAITARDDLPCQRSRAMFRMQLRVICGCNYCSSVLSWYTTLFSYRSEQIFQVNI